MKLDHIAIIASDYQKALAFYGILGFQEIERVKRPFDGDVGVRRSVD